MSDEMTTEDIDTATRALTIWRDEQEPYGGMMTLALVTLASLRSSLAEMTSRAERAEKEKGEAVDAAAALLRVLPRPNEEQEVRWKAAPDTGQAAVTWAVESAAHSLRREIEHSPPEKRNRLTVFVYFGDEKWNLTLARGDFDHAVEKQRDDARSNADHFRGLATSLRARLAALEPVLAAAKVYREAHAALQTDGAAHVERYNAAVRDLLAAALADAGKEP